MPTYEYVCKSCGEHLEVVQSFRDDALTTCPNCGGALRKVFGNIGIAFKGSGFYKTDSRSSSSATASKSASTSGERTSGASGGTSDGASSSSGSGTSDGASSSGSSASSSGSSGTAAAAS